MLLALTFLALVATAACGAPQETAAGYVIDVKSTSLTQIDSFTLRTNEGAELVFRVGALDLNGGGFPGSHLREHMATNQPVAVAFGMDGENRVATRLVDAPWLKP